MKARIMKAIVCKKYGSPDHLELQHVEKPIPEDGEILVKTIATPVTTADTMMRKGTPLFARLFLGLFKPKNSIIGTGFAGEVEAVGKGVRQFNEGDAVVGETAFGFSANAEYVCVPEDGVVIKKPSNLSFEEAAPLCDGSLTSLNFLKYIGKVKKGQSVLINGASGSLGTAAVQLVKYFGGQVTAVCSGKNSGLVRSLGADRVIDYTQSDFTEGAEKYDVIYDTVGKSSFGKCRKVLKRNGVYLSPVLSLGLLFQMLLTSLLGMKKALFAATGMLPKETLRSQLEELDEIIAEDQLKTVIDRSFPLADAAAAHRYVDTGRKRGNVILHLKR